MNEEIQELTDVAIEEVETPAALRVNMIPPALLLLLFVFVLKENRWQSDGHVSGLSPRSGSHKLFPHGSMLDGARLGVIEGLFVVGLDEGSLLGADDGP